MCGTPVNVPDDVLPGELIEHEECGALLEVYQDGGNTFALRRAEGISEDWGE